MTNIAILGAGHIAHSMARTLVGMKARGQDVCLYAVASRELSRAQAFADLWGFEKAYGSYEDMVKDDRVDLVYIATPHSHHAEQIRLCVEHGRAVLCEKAFTGNARQAREVLALAKEKGVLVTEAIWTRYMPARKLISDLLAEGAVGEPKVLTANLGYPTLHKERMIRPELAGGALLDLTIYPLNFASMAFGDDVVRTVSHAEMTDTGIDHTDTIDLYYRDGKVAKLYATGCCRTDRAGWIHGTEGSIWVDNVNNPGRIRVYENPQTGEGMREIPVPEQITGYEYQVESCLRALANGEVECPEMPHAQTIYMMEMMDAFRAEWGVRYPFD